MQEREWAMKSLDELSQAKAGAGNLNQARGGGRSGPLSQKKSTKKQGFFLPAILIVMGCAVFLFAAWSAVRSPVLASILGSSPSSTIAQQPRVSFARVEIPKPANQGQPVVQVADLAATPTVMIAPSPTTEISVASVSITEKL